MNKGLTFIEMMQKDGLYIDANGNFAEGVAYQVKNGTLTVVEYKNKNDMCPTQIPLIITNTIVNYSFNLVLNRGQLFSK